MKITYIHHSSFCVELDNSILLFDYFKGELPEFDKNKKLYVFSSHFHQDHFNKCIFDIQNHHPDVSYILSKDIRAKKDFNRVFVKANDKIIVDDIQIITLESSDIGVAFLVKCEDKVIYHAGDLNWWHWEGENSPKENKFAEDKFKSGLKPIEGMKIDVAFVPLDSRQGEQYYLGFDYFMRNTKTKVAFPMHFWNDYSLCKKFKLSEYARDYAGKIIEVHKQNEVFEIK